MLRLISMIIKRIVIIFPYCLYLNVYGQDIEPIQPIPLKYNLDARKIAIGERLFFDKRLSKDNSLSCASCHNFMLGGSDGLPTSIGMRGKKRAVNAPTIFNSSLNFRQFWDGRAETLEKQLDIVQHDVMNTTWNEVINKLSKDSSIIAQFKSVYQNKINSTDITDALVTYERSLITPNARFDKYLRGDKNALNTKEIQGYRLFKQYGCVACHQGMNIGGNMFQILGVVGQKGDYFIKRGHINKADLGRYNITKNEWDKYVFKVPSLRNIALTAPYLHDGSAATLEEAVNVMFKYQLGRSAPQHDKDLIIKFLGTLTGEYQGKLLSNKSSSREKINF